MYVRLAFAVAAHLESEICNCRRSLSCGDAEFQKKAIGKNAKYCHNTGRTSLIRQSYLAAVQQLCNRGTILKMDNDMLETVSLAIE